MGVLAALAERRGQLFPFSPICLGLGIGAYFALPVEPGLLHWTVLGAVFAVVFLVALRVPETVRPLALAVVLVLGGLLLAGARNAMVTAPVLDYRVYGPVEGRVIGIDRSFSDAPRLLLDKVWLAGLPAGQTPQRVRISLQGVDAGAEGLPAPGAMIGVTANLSPPPAPAEPGGYSFQRQAWFDRLGAVGYTRAPPVLLDRPEGAFVHRMRMRLSAAIRARVPGDEGAFAAAILTGDRSAISRDTVQSLRDSNLAHLLAISGLHMGLLTAFIFAALRSGLALIPPLALRLPVKKIAAVLALVAAAVYLMLSGGNVATRRAFIMVAVMLVAVLADRRALTLRAVALAALIVLVLQPESLTRPGFQMSFSATTALVAAFSALRAWPEGAWRPPGWARAVLAVVLSSGVAGLATAPFGAAHFNQVAQYGLLANVLTVPLVGILVIPAAVLAGLLAPFGLEMLGLAPMQLGITWILGVARFVAGLDGATWPVVSPGPLVLPLLALGSLWAVLWRGRAGLAGLLPMAAALALWAGAERPALLIADSGGLVGVMTPEGRALNKPRGDGFVARSWLENDGDAASPEEAFERAGFAGTPGMLETRVGDQLLVHVSGRGWAARVPEACARGWVVMAREPENLPPGCMLIGPAHLRRTGALALRPGGADGVEILSAKEASGDRPWVH